MFRNSVLMMMAVGVLGCSKSDRPPTYPVTGTVFMNGSAVDGASVVLVPNGSAGEAATGRTNAAGEFSLATYVAGDGARPGEYRVKVSKFNVQAAAPDEKDRFMSYEEEQEIYEGNGNERPIPPAKNLLPPKFGNETTSGITHTVKEEPTRLEIKLNH